MTRNHYASNEIKEKLVELTEQRNGMLHKWEERWEHLQLILEVYQFARDAAVAEAWLIAQDPYLKSEDLGVKIKSIFSILRYIKQIEQIIRDFYLKFIALSSFSFNSIRLTRWKILSRDMKLLKRPPPPKKKDSSP